MKIYIAIITLFIVNYTIAQSNIEVPTFQTVQVRTNSYNHITMTVDKKGEITLEREKIKLSALRAKVFELLYNGMKHNTGLGPLFLTELVVDKDLPYTKLAPVLNELRKMSVLAVFFTCNSETDQRIPKTKMAGFGYKLPTSKNRNSVAEAVSKKIKSEKNRRKNMEEDLMMPPPPPSISSEYLRNNSGKVESKVIGIHHQSYTIDNEKLSAAQLAEKFMQWSSKKKVAYILEPTENATYEDVVTPIAQLLTTLKIIRTKESMRLYGKEYDNLDSHKKLEVKQKVPFMLILGDE